MVIGATVRPSRAEERACHGQPPIDRWWSSATIARGLRAAIVIGGSRAADCELAHNRWSKGLASWRLHNFNAGGQPGLWGSARAGSVWSIAWRTWPLCPPVASGERWASTHLNRPQLDAGGRDGLEAIRCPAGSGDRRQA